MFDAKVLCSSPDSRQDTKLSLKYSAFRSLIWIFINFFKRPIWNSLYWVWGLSLFTDEHLVTTSPAVSADLSSTTPERSEPTSHAGTLHFLVFTVCMCAASWQTNYFKPTNSHTIWQHLVLKHQCAEEICCLKHPPTNAEFPPEG